MRKIFGLEYTASTRQTDIGQLIRLTRPCPPLDEDLVLTQYEAQSRADELESGGHHDSSSLALT
jgi:hypothetical protein